MKLHFTNEWLLKKLATDPDHEPEAGMPEEAYALEAIEADVETGKVAALSERGALQMRIGLGVLVRKLRHRDGLSINALASAADVPEDELRQVEQNPQYTARPRLIFKLSDYFQLPLANLSQMAGATQVVDRILFNEVVRYAASSDDISTLSEHERAALNEFVSALQTRAKA